MSDPEISDVGLAASRFMEATHGEIQIKRQLASGAAVHFGDQAMFIPGHDPEALLALVHQRTEELACAYRALEHAVMYGGREDMS